MTSSPMPKPDSGAPTPGPWSVKRSLSPVDGHYDFAISVEIAGRPHVIAETYGICAADVALPAEANARLIAAAPKMAELLRKITCASMSETRPTRGESFIGWQQGDGATADEVRHEARALLSKIQGSHA